MISIITESIKF